MEAAFGIVEGTFFLEVPPALPSILKTVFTLATKRDPAERPNFKEIMRLLHRDLPGDWV